LLPRGASPAKEAVMTMSPDLAIEALFADLLRVAAHAPNERLPKEEQSRCCLYAYLRPLWEVVCVERGYTSVDEGGKQECDLCAFAANRPPLWLELKHCRCASGGWQNKPSEERDKWEDDLDKLRVVGAESDRYFILVCFSDFDPRSEELPRHGRVLQNIREFHGSQLIHQASQAFSWRHDDGITHLGAWVWHWGLGAPISGRAEESVVADRPRD
jgi:hypothetical protein